MDGKFKSDYEAFDAEFLRAAQTAAREARAESFRLGLSVFYTDHETGHHMMEQPDGRRFVIEFIPGASREENHKIIREVAPSERSTLNQLAS